MRKLSEIQADFDKAMEAENGADNALKYLKELNNANEELKTLLIEIPLERLQEIALAEKAGTLIIPPCKVGDTVYWPSRFSKSVSCGPVTGILISGFGFDLKITHINGTTVTKEAEKVFLTKEAAEAALKEREQNDH